jgi:methylenetetrahydrofolate reductase (NADPH)
VSITDGAAGSTKTRTREWVLRILQETNLRVAPHLTCVGTSREEVLATAQDYWAHGVRHVVALRGDRPQESAAHRLSPPDTFRYASELVAELCGAADFDISVAAYPEGHPESCGIEADIENLKRKVDAGATCAITQFFFDTSSFLRYRDRCAAACIDVSLVPGILPITRFNQLMRFASRCGASVPQWLQQRFTGLDEDADTLRMLAAHVAIEQVQELQRHGVDAFHFYTLNRAELTYAICHALGLNPRQAQSIEAA